MILLSPLLKGMKNPSNPFEAIRWDSFDKFKKEFDQKELGLFDITCKGHQAYFQKESFMEKNSFEDFIRIFLKEGYWKMFFNEFLVLYEEFEKREERYSTNSLLLMLKELSLASGLKLSELSNSETKKINVEPSFWDYKYTTDHYRYFRRIRDEDFSMNAEEATTDEVSFATDLLKLNEDVIEKIINTLFKPKIDFANLEYSRMVSKKIACHFLNRNDISVRAKFLLEFLIFQSSSFSSNSDYNSNTCKANVKFTFTEIQSFNLEGFPIQAKDFLRYLLVKDLLEEETKEELSLSDFDFFLTEEPKFNKGK